MNKTYNRINWENYPSDKTPVNEHNLNRIDYSVDEQDNRIITLEETKATKVEVSTLIKEVAFDEMTGIITFTRKNGSKFTIDTAMEKIATGIFYDPVTEMLSLPLIDGTKIQVDLSRLITEYEFLDSETIDFSVGTDGKITAIVKEGSIQEKHLRPDYLADIRVESAKAEASAAAADASKKSAKQSETNAKKSETNAKASELAAANSASEADDSAAAALASQNAAKVSETNAKASETKAKTSETNAKNSETKSASSATTATTKAGEAKTSAQNASVSEENARKYAEQIEDAATKLEGALVMQGTITFAQLPTLANAEKGWMFNISDSFVTTDDFEEGAGIVIADGSNVYKNGNGKWDVLAGNFVAGVKGANENMYRKGLVNLTPKNIGAIPGMIAMTGGVNLDDYKTPGVYYASANTVMSNQPNPGNSFTLIVTDAGVHTSQLAILSNSNASIYTRYYNRNTTTWEPWIQHVVGVKGNAETTYRGGNVNLTPGNIGAFPSMSSVTVGANTDWDTITDCGVYNVKAATMDASHHAPVDFPNGGVLIVFYKDFTSDQFLFINTVIQLYIPYNSKGIAYRQSNVTGSSGNIWYYIYDTKQNDATYVKKAGDTVTGTLILSKTTDASGGSDNGPALIVGGPRTGAHLELDANEIMAKSNGTTPNSLYLNADGGDVVIGPSNNTKNTTIRNRLVTSMPVTKKHASSVSGLMVGTSGTDGWIVAIQIKIKASYINHTLVFEILSRGYSLPIYIYPYFQSTDSTDPNMTCYISGYGSATNVVRYKKIGTSTWQIVVKKNEAHGSLMVSDIKSPSDFNSPNVNIEITYPGTLLSTAPDSTWSTPDWGGKVNTANNADHLDRLRVYQNTTGAHSVATNAIGYISGLAASVLDDGSFTDAALIKQYYNDRYEANLIQSYRNGRIATRSKNNGTYTAWRRLAFLDEVNTIGNTLKMTDGSTVQNVIKLHDDGDGATNYGGELVITGAGNTFIGAGESPTALRTALQGGSFIGIENNYTKSGEKLYLTSDTSIFIETNANTIANRKGLVFDNSGNFYPVVSGGWNLGHVNYKWKKLYCNDIFIDAADITDVSSNGMPAYKLVGMDKSVSFAIMNSIGDCGIFDDKNRKWLLALNRLKCSIGGCDLILGSNNADKIEHTIYFFDDFSLARIVAAYGDPRDIDIYCDTLHIMSVRSSNTYSGIKASAFMVMSSRRYKKNIEDMQEEEARKLLELRPVSYDYIEEANGVNQFGLIAEEAEEHISSAVTYDEEGRPDSIDYSKFVPHLIKMVQMQEKEIRDQRDEIDSLKEENQNLKERMDKLEETVQRMVQQISA